MNPSLMVDVLAEQLCRSSVEQPCGNSVVCVFWHSPVTGSLPSELPLEGEKCSIGSSRDLQRETTTQIFSLAPKRKLHSLLSTNLLLGTQTLQTVACSLNYTADVLPFPFSFREEVFQKALVKEVFVLFSKRDIRSLSAEELQQSIPFLYWLGNERLNAFLECSVAKFGCGLLKWSSHNLILLEFATSFSASTLLSRDEERITQTIQFAWTQLSHFTEHRMEAFKKALRLVGKLVKGVSRSSTLYFIFLLTLQNSWVLYGISGHPLFAQLFTHCCYFTGKDNVELALPGDLVRFYDRFTSLAVFGYRKVEMSSFFNQDQEDHYLLCLSRSSCASETTTLPPRGRLVPLTSTQTESLFTEYAQRAFILEHSELVVNKEKIDSLPFIFERTTVKGR